MDSSIKRYIADTIVKRRIEIGMEQEELCDYADIGISTLSKLENAKANVTIETLEKIINILGLEIMIQTKQTI